MLVARRGDSHGCDHSGRSLDIRLIGFAAGLLFFLIGAVHALMIPLDAGYDEPAHMIKAVGVAHGQFYGNGTWGDVEGDDYPIFSVPASVACMRLSDQPVGCAGASPTTIIEATSTTGYYNPLYYAMAGLPSLFIAGAMLPFAMRLFSVLIVSFLGGIAVAMLAGCSSARITVPLLILSTSPLFFFLLGQVNPNALEAVCALGVAATLLRIFETASDAPRKGTWAILVVFSVLLANTRSLGVGWLLAIVMVTALLAGRATISSLSHQRGAQISLLLIVVGVVGALVDLRRSGALEHFLPVSDGIGLSPPEAALAMMRRAPDEFVNMFTWLGLPGHVISSWWAIMYGGLFLLIGVGAVILSRGVAAKAAVALCALVYLAAPPVLGAPGAREAGLIWQPRYEMGWLMVCVAVCLHQAFPRADAEGLASRRRWAVGSGVAVCLGAFAIVQYQAITGFADIWASLTWEGVYVARGLDPVQPFDAGSAYPGRAATVALVLGISAVVWALSHRGRCRRDPNGVQSLR